MKDETGQGFGSASIFQGPWYMKGSPECTRFGGLGFQFQASLSDLHAPFWLQCKSSPQTEWPFIIAALGFCKHCFMFWSVGLRESEQVTSPRLQAEGGSIGSSNNSSGISTRRRKCHSARTRVLSCFSKPVSCVGVNFLGSVTKLHASIDCYADAAIPKLAKL